MKASEILADIITMFKRPSCWTQRAYARERPKGVPTEVSNPDATCFCLTGAIQRVAPGNDGDARYWLHEAIRKEHFGNGGIVSFNDAPGRTIQEVRKVLKTAHALALATEDYL